MKEYIYSRPFFTHPNFTPKIRVICSKNENYKNFKIKNPKKNPSKCKFRKALFTNLPTLKFPSF